MKIIHNKGSLPPKYQEYYVQFINLQKLYITTAINTDCFSYIAKNCTNLIRIKVASYIDNWPHKGTNQVLISSIETISALIKLQKLTLICTSIKDWRPISSLTELTFLDISHHENIPVDLEIFKPCFGMCTLWLNSTNIKNIKYLTVLPILTIYVLIRLL